MGERRLRAVTHLDVSRKQVDAAVDAMARVLSR
jgi:threonine aldolase